MGALFNVGTFTGSDGDGCATSYNQSGSTLQINWSSGTNSTSGSGYMYIVRITLKNSSKEITSIIEAGW